jgi:hypothetical protein
VQKFSSCFLYYFRHKDFISGEWKIENMTVDWKWFRCEVNKKCIHPKSRCDLHPHPACVYNNTETGKNKTEMVAEDEEGCLKEYKVNGLIETSANLECDSPVHNNDTAAIVINSTLFNWTKYDATKKRSTSYKNNVIVIEAGTTVQIQAVKCNGISECWKGVDDSDCGFSTFETMIFGNTCFFP